MTTPKPKARKAACVWIVEMHFEGEWVATVGIAFSRHAGGEVLKEWRRKKNASYKFRIRKYQRIDK